MSFTIQELRKTFPESKLVGDHQLEITIAIGIQDALGANLTHSMSWVNDKKGLELDPLQVHLGLLILSPAAFAHLQKADTAFLIADNPRATFFKIVEKYFSTHRMPKIESTARIDPSSSLGSGCYIGHNVVIEKDCVIGDNTTILHNSVVMEGTVIGKNVTIGCNNTIGNYGFGYEKDSDGDYFVLQHIGRVVIHDHVEIHNNTCIDRGVLGTTEIHENVKIDNQVHIAHGVVIERNALIIANAMIGGSARIGENTWIAPSVSIKNQITVARDTMTGIGAVILKDTKEKSVMIGNPAVTMEEHKKWSEIKKKLG